MTEEERKRRFYPTYTEEERKRRLSLAYDLILALPLPQKKKPPEEKPPEGR